MRLGISAKKRQDMVNYVSIYVKQQQIMGIRTIKIYDMDA